MKIWGEIENSANCIHVGLYRHQGYRVSTQPRLPLPDPLRVLDPLCDGDSIKESGPGCGNLFVV